jgi:demethylmenaquinone methyltransferase/2-methoxy-6-polyprenyl-1,4-benzoquinol methylase
MINKEDVIEFFDRCAPSWDAEMIRNDRVIDTILDNAEVSAGCSVLDVACGTGVLIPDYLKRKVGSVTGIDISEKMTEIARSKFDNDNVFFICDDVEKAELGRTFDRIVVYNAFPHFPDAEALIRKLSSMLSAGGILTVAHGMSKAKIDMHHRHVMHVSNGLMEAEDLAEIFGRYLDVTVVISNDEMYQVAGKKPKLQER